MVVQVAKSYEHGITDVTKGLTKSGFNYSQTNVKGPALEMSEKAISESAEKLVKEWNKLLVCRVLVGRKYLLANVPFGEKIFGKHAQ